MASTVSVNPIGVVSPIAGSIGDISAGVVISATVEDPWEVFSATAIKNG